MIGVVDETEAQRGVGELAAAVREWDKSDQHNPSEAHPEQGDNQALHRQVHRITLLLVRPGGPGDLSSIV
jgi:hypothetical protein